MDTIFTNRFLYDEKLYLLLNDELHNSIINHVNHVTTWKISNKVYDNMSPYLKRKIDYYTSRATFENGNLSRNNFPITIIYDIANNYFTISQTLQFLYKPKKSLQSGGNAANDNTEEQQVQEEPQQVKEEPQQVQEEPQQVKEEPQQVKEEPQQVQEKPQQVKEEPQQVQEEPQQVQEEPQQVQEEPQQVQEKPQQVQEEPQQVQEKPQQVQEEPQQVQEEPQQVKEEPQQVQEEPQEKPSIELQEIDEDNRKAKNKELLKLLRDSLPQDNNQINKLNKNMDFSKMNKNELYKFWENVDLKYMEFDNSLANSNYPNRSYWHYVIKDLGETIYHSNDETPIEYLIEINKYVSPNYSINIKKLNNLEEAIKLWNKMKTNSPALKNNNHIYNVQQNGG